MHVNKIEGLVWNPLPRHQQQHVHTELPRRTQEQRLAEIAEMLRICKDIHKSIQEADIEEQSLKHRPLYCIEAITETSSKFCAYDLAEFDLSAFDEAEALLANVDSGDSERMEKVLESLSHLANHFDIVLKKMQIGLPLLNQATLAVQNAAVCTNKASEALKNWDALQVEEEDIDIAMARCFEHLVLLSSKKAELMEKNQRKLQEASKKTAQTPLFTQDSDTAGQLLAAAGYMLDESDSLESAKENVHQARKLSRAREHPSDIQARHEFQRSIYQQLIQKLASGEPRDIACFVNGADGGNNGLRIEDAVRKFPFRTSELTFKEVVQEVKVQPFVCILCS